MNEHLQKLQPYPFQKLTELLENAAVETEEPPIALSIGEPQHSPPEFLLELMQNKTTLSGALGSYPPTKGLPELRRSISNFLSKRYKLNSDLDPESQILPVNGTREALFAIAQCILSNRSDNLVLMPNPFYQIYEGAAILSGSTPRYINCFEDNNFQPAFKDISEPEWRKCELLYICSPGNPSGASINIETMQGLITLSDQYEFVIISDECYSEIYQDENNPPPGLLQASDLLGRKTYKNCLTFNSLSKRSNLPGLRSGFVAGDEELIEKFLLYRTYHGSAMPLHHQLISAKAWADESHVINNRGIYREKFSSVLEILDHSLSVQQPACGFYLWPKTPASDTKFTYDLFRETNVKVLPGSFLSRNTPSGNPGENRVRIALVQPLEECIEAAYRIKRFMMQK